MIGGFVVPVPTSSEFNPESVGLPSLLLIIISPFRSLQDLDLEYSMPIVYPLVPTLYQIVSVLQCA